MATLTAIIDADSFAWRAALRGQETYQWDEHAVSESLDLGRAVKEFDRIIQEFIDSLEPDHVVLAFGDSANWRKDLMPTYKANRPASKPKLLAHLRDYAAERYKVYVRPRLEADDVVGILATHPRLLPGDKVIVSIDKDMKQIPAMLWNPDKDVLPTEQIDCAYAHMYQTLVGDATDNYPGCPGIGPKRAERILSSLQPSQMWDAVVRAFESRGLTEEDALLQARVARILQHTDYDYKRKEIKLWDPSSLA